MVNKEEETLCEICNTGYSSILIDGETTYTLCPDHLRSLVNCRLSAKDAKKLIEKHGNETFYLHDDFYDEKGNALQPKYLSPT